MCFFVFVLCVWGGGGFTKVDRNALSDTGPKIDARIPLGGGAKNNYRICS